MKNIAKITTVIILLAALFSSVSASAENSAAPFMSLEFDIVKLFNQARADAGMASLEQDETLTALARLKAEEMADKRLDTIDLPDGLKHFLNENNAESKAQNCYSAADKNTAGEVVSVWKRHANFDRDTWAKEKLTHISVGAAKDADGKMYYACIVTKPFDNTERTALEDEVIRLINAERKKQGLTLLIKNDDLTKVTRMKAQDMADNDYCAHESPTYGSPSKMVKTYAKGVAYGGENIAAGQKTANEVFKAWKNSPAHKATMFKKTVNCIGVGVAVDSKGNYVWSLIVGKK